MCLGNHLTGSWTSGGRVVVLTCALLMNSMIAWGDEAVSFITGSTIPEPAGSVALADFNDDGLLDIVYTSSCVLKVRMGDGSGAFGAEAFTSPLGLGLCRVAVGDLNGDGATDIAVAYGFYAPSHPGKVATFISDGQGQFTPGPVLSAGDYPSSIALGDLNKDGLNELVIGYAVGNSTTVFLSTGGGSFSAGVNYTTGGSPVDGRVADVDNDGSLDILTANVDDGTVSFLKGDGEGGFSVPVDFPASPYPKSVWMDDLDGDGLPDLLVANDGTDYVSVLYGRGWGDFETPVPIQVGYYPHLAIAHDVTGDNKPDLIVATNFNGGTGSNAIYVLRNLGNRVFDQPVQVFLPGGNYVDDLDVAVGDLNRDRRTDLSIAGSASITTMLNTARYPTVDFDLTGDGKADIVLRNMDTGYVYMWAMDGNLKTQYGISTLPLNREVVGIADLTGDGKADIVLRNVDTGYVYMWAMDGNLKTQYGISTLPLNREVVGIADLTGDGKADIVLRNVDTGYVYMWAMDGNLKTQYGIRSLSLDWRVVQASDLDGDTKADLVLRNTLTGYMKLWKMDGNLVTENQIGPLLLSREVQPSALPGQ